MLERLLKAPVEIRTPDGLIQAAWKVADELGWAKTYDAAGVDLVTIQAAMGHSALATTSRYLHARPASE